jgi:hypothetical protein
MATGAGATSISTTRWRALLPPGGGAAARLLGPH